MAQLVIVEIAVKIKENKWDKYEEDNKDTDNEDSDCDEENAGVEKITYNSIFAMIAMNFNYL